LICSLQYVTTFCLAAFPHSQIFMVFMSGDTFVFR
jgi:hypothetical protein